MSVPSLVRLRNVKVPVSDLPTAVEWYGKTLGFRSTIDFRDDDGVVRGVHGELPHIGAVLALREDPDAARGLGGFAISNFEVADRAALETWAAHLDNVGVEHDQIVDAPRVSVLVFRDPDGHEIHLYTPISV
jgi:catechol 2,3-dioxygenase-like lactoylglutathione lyase family enzyme